MTLGPVSLQASLVTLKMPAPIRIPISAAYDSTVPRSRRRRLTRGVGLSWSVFNGLDALANARATAPFTASSIHLPVNLNEYLLGCFNTSHGKLCCLDQT